MSRNRKRFIHGVVYDLTFRVEEGLPFAANPYMRLIIESYLARAQQMYFVRIAALVVMGNHLHVMIVVHDPAAVPDFMEYFKRETSIAVNRLLGRERRTVWVEGYDSPHILDSEKAIERLIYYYTNPQRARLVNSIDEYPQLNTWAAFLSGGVVKRVIPTFPRPAIPFLHNDPNPTQAEQIYRSILEEKNGEAELLFEPFAWLDVFPDTKDCSPQAVIDQVLTQVRSAELLLRHEHGESVLGAEALKTQSIRKPHTPKKRGRRMICLATCKIKRREYLQWFFDESRYAGDSIKRWIEHKVPLSLPPGFFAPGGMLFANVLSWILFT